MQNQGLPSIRDSYIFNFYDKNINYNSILGAIVPKSMIIEPADIALQLQIINKRYHFGMKNKVLQGWKEGKYILLFNDTVDKRLPDTLPVFLLNKDRKVVSCVNLSNKMRRNRDGVIDIDTAVLYSYMTAGYIQALCYEKINIMKNKAGIIKHGSFVYSKMFTKVINKIYTMCITPGKLDTIVYLSSLFFLTNLLRRNSPQEYEMNKKYAFENCDSANRLTVGEYAIKFGPEDFVSFGSFIESLKRIIGLENIEVRKVLDGYIAMFGATFLLSLDYLPLFLINIAYSDINAGLNRSEVIENLIGTRYEILDELALL